MANDDTCKVHTTVVCVCVHTENQSNKEEKNEDI